MGKNGKTKGGKYRKGKVINGIVQKPHSSALKDQKNLATNS
jgi:hypothetical protein